MSEFWIATVAGLTVLLLTPAYVDLYRLLRRNPRRLPFFISLAVAIAVAIYALGFFRPPDPLTAADLHQAIFLCIAFTTAITGVICALLEQIIARL